MGVNLAAKVKITTTDGKRVHANVITPDLLLGIIGRRKSPDGMGKFVTGISGLNSNYKVRAITILDPKTGKLTTGALGENGEVLRDSEKLVKYSQMSMSKPVAEALAKSLIGVNAFKALVGSDASGRPYDSDVTYPDRPAIPYNGNVNIGALKVWDILVSEAKKQKVEPIKLYMDFLKKLTNNDTPEVNRNIADGQFNYPPLDGGESNNMKLLAKLQEHGNLENQREEVYKAYCDACAVMITSEDSVRIRSKFENGTDPATGERLMSQVVAEHTKRSMTISGMYDESGYDYANFGVEGAKSGVDGGIMFGLKSKIPGNPDLIVAVHHAGLNPRGNSAEGTKWMKDLSRMTLISSDDPLLSNPKTIAKGAFKEAKNLWRERFSFRPAEAGAAGSSSQSQAEIDRELGNSMTQGGRDRLEAKIREQLALKGESYKGGLYLKHLKSANSLNGGSLLFTEADTNGNMKSYYHVPDRHHLEKVVVVDARGQSDFPDPAET